jgi:signal transduction histidine kinase
MRYLGRTAGGSGQAFPLAPLIDEAWQEAQKHQPVKKAKYSNDFAKRPVFIPGDRLAIKHAMTELLLNALQARPDSPEIEVRGVSAGDDGVVCIEIEDNGPGFTAEAQAKAGTPFFTTRIPGVGIGLLVTRRIIESNHGKLEIPQAGKPGLVRIHLPAEKPAAK